MRQILIVTTAVWIAVVIALFGATAMIAHAPQKAEAITASGSIDITRDVKPLPIEQFDAI